MKDYIIMVQDLLIGRNDEFDAANKKISDSSGIKTTERKR